MAISILHHLQLHCHIDLDLNLGPPDALCINRMSHLGIQFQPNETLLRLRMRLQGHGLILLAQAREEILHLEVSKLLTRADPGAVVEWDILPLVLRLPVFYHIVVSRFSWAHDSPVQGLLTPSFRPPLIDVIYANVVAMLQG